MRTKATALERRSVDALLLLAAELERAHERPSEAQIRDMSARLGLDRHTIVSAIRLRFGPSNGGVGPALLAQGGSFVTRGLSEPGRALVSWFVRRPYLVSLLVTAVCVTSLLTTVVMGQMTAIVGYPGAWVAPSIIGAYLLVMCGMAYIIASVRRALKLAALASLLWLMGVLVLFLPDAETIRQQAVLIVTLSVSTYLSLLLGSGSLMVFAAAAGAYVTTVRTLKAECDADRHTLLRRVFDLSARLNDGSERAESTEEAEGQSAGEERRAGLSRLCLSAVSWVRGHLLLGTLLIILGLDALRFGLDAALAASSAPQPELSAAMIALFGPVMTIVRLVVLFQLGVMAARFSVAAAVIGMSAVASALFAAAAATVFPTPLLQIAGAPALDPLTWSIAAGVNQFALALLGTGAGAMAGAYRAFHERERRLAANDREAIVEELEQLTARLRQDARPACFLCVDVVGSTKMKENADPLAVEYSFTEFHRFVAERVIANGGIVHSTAGDNCVATFPEVASAVSAGSAIQRELEELNGASNTLSGPFLLRIGIHAGRVSGEGHTIAFSHALDVCVHVEAACPPGAIAVTVTALSELDEAPPHECLGERVDDFEVAILRP